jgi:hypothetical protein
MTCGLRQERLLLDLNGCISSPPLASGSSSGAGNRNRTRVLRITRALLWSSVSYTGGRMERIAGNDPAQLAWKARVLPIKRYALKKGGNGQIYSPARLGVLEEGASQERQPNC